MPAQRILPSMPADGPTTTEAPQTRLRALTADCRAAAWLRFARAPVVDNGRVFDLRFETAARGNFTSMSPVAGDGQAECPGFVPDWEMPRADALRRR